MFPDLGEVTLCRRHSMELRNTLPLVTRAKWSRGAPYVGCVGSFTVVGLDPGLLGCQSLPHVEAAHPLVSGARSCSSCLWGLRCRGARASLLAGSQGPMELAWPRSSRDWCQMAGGWASPGTNRLEGSLQNISC